MDSEDFNARSDLDQSMVESTNVKTTKELAIEKGLFRVRRPTTSSQDSSLPFKSRRRQRGDLEFQYIFSLDFESTCWQDSPAKFQEIIEFPVIMRCMDSIQSPGNDGIGRPSIHDAEKNHSTPATDTDILSSPASGIVLEKFHEYVVPTENPTLSEFCVSLTGISQDIIDLKAIPLALCLQRLLA